MKITTFVVCRFYIQDPLQHSSHAFPFPYSVHPAMLVITHVVFRVMFMLIVLCKLKCPKSVASSCK